MATDILTIQSSPHKSSQRELTGEFQNCENLFLSNIWRLFTTEKIDKRNCVIGYTCSAERVSSLDTRWKKAFKTCLGFTGSVLCECAQDIFKQEVVYVGFIWNFTVRRWSYWKPILLAGGFWRRYDLGWFDTFGGSVVWTGRQFWKCFWAGFFQFWIVVRHFLACLRVLWGNPECAWIFLS